MLKVPQDSSKYLDYYFPLNRPTKPRFLNPNSEQGSM